MTLAPIYLFRSIIARKPPFSVVFTDCESMMLEGINNVSHRIFAMSSTRFFRRQQGLKNLPLGIRKIS
jgi:hypothetical protein